MYNKLKPCNYRVTAVLVTLPMGTGEQSKCKCNDQELMQSNSTPHPQNQKVTRNMINNKAPPLWNCGRHLNHMSLPGNEYYSFLLSLFCAHDLIIFYICTKFHENSFYSFKVTKQTPFSKLKLQRCILL